MKIYLAARYSRRLELCRYRDQLQEMGHTVTSRWLDGDHQISESGEPHPEGDDGSTSDRSAKLRQKFANDDYADILACNILIAFTEPPNSGHSRGGRHVELGLALALMKRVVVIGYRENLFCWHEDVRFFETFDDVLLSLKRPTKAGYCISPYPPDYSRQWTSKCARCGSQTIVLGCTSCRGDGQHDTEEGPSACSMCCGHGEWHFCNAPQWYCERTPIQGRRDIVSGELEWFAKEAT